jgi:hypothetical protein
LLTCLRAHDTQLDAMTASVQQLEKLAADGGALVQARTRTVRA